MKSRLVSLVSIYGLVLGIIATNANAAIVNYHSYLGMSATAGHASNGPYDQQHVNETDLTSYTNTISVSANDSGLRYVSSCNCYVTDYASASSSTSLDAQANLATGLFTGSASYSAAATGWLGAGGSALVDFRFDITTPYRYTLDLVASAGSAASVNFYGRFQDPSDRVYFSYENGGVNIHQSGMFLPQSYYSGPYYGIIVSILGCQSGCIADDPNGSMQFTLQLTPVPLPAAVWLLGSGLVGMVGIARKIRTKGVMISLSEIAGTRKPLICP